MKIYDLYKFNRFKNFKDERIYIEFKNWILYKYECIEDVNFDVLFNGSRVLDEIFKDIRECLRYVFILLEDERGNICCRIMFKWYLGENLDDVYRVIEVFWYICRIIELFEDGEDVDVDDIKEFFNRRCFWSEKFFNEFDRVYEWEKEY